MKNIHDQAREFLAGDGIKLTDTQKRAVFLFADYVYNQDIAVQTKKHDKETLERIAFLEKELAAQGKL